jgi:hypothetical protein
MARENSGKGVRGHCVGIRLYRTVEVRPGSSVRSGSATERNNDASCVCLSLSRTHTYTDGLMDVVMLLCWRAAAGKTESAYSKRSALQLLLLLRYANAAIP